MPEFCESQCLKLDIKKDKEAFETELFVDEKGRLTLPKEILHMWDIAKETKLSICHTPEGLLLKRTDPPLTKVYIEPTNTCNLSCRTCVRNSWNEPAGMMNMETYRKLIINLKNISSLQKISFWGFGEPLLHPDIVEMVTLAKQLGVETQIITNALLLDEAKSEGLIAAGLDSIVISVDGTESETNADIRSGASLEQIKKNVNRLRDIRRNSPNHNPEIGIEYVVMRSNIKELKNLHKVALDMGASFIVISNLLPYTEELKGEVLYWNSTGLHYQKKRSKWAPEISLPNIDLRPEVVDSFSRFMGYNGTINLTSTRSNEKGGYCRFVEEGSAVVAWDGEVSPCVALMHSYKCYVMMREKKIRRYTLGNIAHEEMTNIWESDEYVKFRDIVKCFDFSPCTECGGCDFSETNEEDCYGNVFPVCGDCLWAKGVIQCP